MKKSAIVMMGLLWASLICAPVSASVVVAHMTPPPCTGQHCLVHRRGVAMPGVDPAHRAPCPHGTVYNAQRGTCKVFATH